MKLHVLLFTIAIASAAAAQQAQPAAPSSPAAHYFANLHLVDQDGRRVDLYRDVMQGHTVVIDTFFATCTGSCPMMTNTLARLQTRFADRLGRDLRLVSITVDPANDSPAKLREYARHVQAKAGWLFLTGTKDEVHAALAKLGQSVETRESHTNVMLVGNDATGLWKKVFGLAKPEEVGDVVETVLDDKGAV